MHFNLITIFPELVENYVSHGIIAKAIEAKKLSIMTWNPREFSADKNKRIDEKPYGGGPGMVLQPEPLIETINHIKKKNKTYVVSMAPHGRVLNQKKLSELTDVDAEAKPRLVNFVSISLLSLFLIWKSLTPIFPNK